MTTEQSRIILTNYQSPGDILMLTSLLRDLHKNHPGKFITDVRTPCEALFENNPYITKLNEDEPGVRKIQCEYPLIHECHKPYHFIHGFMQDLEKKLGISIKPTEFRGDIHISDLEKSWMSQIEETEGLGTRFWLIVSGGKQDFTCIAKGSQVSTSTGYKNIEDVTSKDEVLTEYGYRKCSGAVYKGVKSCLKITTSFRQIQATPDHLFKRLDIFGGIEWVQAKDIKEDDFLLGAQNYILSEDINPEYVGLRGNLISEYKAHGWYFQKVLKIETGDTTEVYDILNSETSSFVCEGMVVHNCKHWDPYRAQQVVDHFQGKIKFVQVGENHHIHPKLNGVIDLVGKTNLRQMVRLMYHADGVVCPVTFLMHLAAAVETKPGRPKSRPCVIIAGGREHTHWEAYPDHQYLHTQSMLPCCNGGGCWKSRIVPLGDGDEKDNSLCRLPVLSSTGSGVTIPKCMDMITAEDVIRSIEKYLVFESEKENLDRRNKSLRGTKKTAEFTGPVTTLRT